VTPYITEFLLREYGWRGTFLIAGGIFLNLLLIGVVVQLNLPPSEGQKKSKDFHWKEQILIFKYRAYSVFAFGMILFGMFGKMVVKSFLYILQLNEAIKPILDKCVD
jgi:predicted MFS family arabinose efflux permease